MCIDVSSWLCNSLSRFLNESICIYVLLFQEVIGTLVSHVGSGMNAEASAALEVLDALVIAKLQDVQRFTLMIKV